MYDIMNIKLSMNGGGGCLLTDVLPGSSIHIYI